jgi:hypothetical protein
MAKVALESTKTERIDLYRGIRVANESSKLPGHKKRMLEHFKRVHRESGPIYDNVAHRRCNCGICTPREDFDWDKLAKRLINDRRQAK